MDEEKVRVTIVLLQDYKRGANNDRVWSNVLALDFVLTEEDDTAGLFRGVYPKTKLHLLERVVGVASVHWRKLEDAVEAPRFTLKASRSVRVKDDERGRKAA